MQMIITKDYHLFQRLAVKVDTGEYDTFVECLYTNNAAVAAAFSQFELA